MYTDTVAGLMTGVTSLDFVQAWYRCVPTNMGNTGMALGGLGSAITMTPSGTTPCFHFYNGCGIENDQGRTIELNNYFYGESRSDDLTLSIRSMSLFKDDVVAFPLVDARGEKYLRGDESVPQAHEVLKRMIAAKTFVDDNYANLAKWGLIEAENRGTLHLARKKDDFRYRNLAFLLNILAFSVTRKVDYTRSLLGDVQRPYRLTKKAYPSNKMLYEFQYPLSQTHYREETQRCIVKKVHLTNLCPGNARLCNMPAYVMDFIVTNPTNDAMDVTFVLSVENFIGYDVVKTRTGMQDAMLGIQRSFKGQKGKSYTETVGNHQVHGLLFHQDEVSQQGDIRGELCFAVATSTADEALVTCKPNYFLGSESSVVDYGIATGKIHDVIDDCVCPSGKEPMCGALCVSLRILPEETKSFSVTTVIDIPEIQTGRLVAQKKYTSYFPEKTDRSRVIAREAIANRKRNEANDWVWRESMHQKQVLDTGLIDAEVAGKLRQLLVDNMSFLAESSVWDENDRIRVRECMDYPFFNSLDVYFYGSFGLLRMLPEADNNVVREFAQTILQEDLRLKFFGSFERFRDKAIDKSLRGPRKVRDSTPHDMGTPFDADANAYAWKDVSRWTDLAPKFVLMVYRNFFATRDRTLLKECWPAVVASMDYVRTKFIDDGGHLPISQGFANTFDNLRGDGICIYPASLWVAGLYAAQAIATLLDEKTQAKAYANAAALGKAQLTAALWDEQQGVYLYSVSTLRKEHLDAQVVADLGKSHDQRIASLLGAMGQAEVMPLNAAALLRSINAFVDDDHATVNREQLAVAGPSLGADHAAAFEQILALPKIERRRLKKRFVHAYAPGIFAGAVPDSALLAESDHIFANQLCADTYLYSLDLPEVTSRESRIRVLSNILAQNIAGCSRRVGASNLVARGGGDLEAAQAQEVWVGVQYSLAGALLAVGMIKEFETLISRLFDAIYVQSKIPFGIPEGFNCVGTLVPEDLVRMGIDDPQRRAQIVSWLKGKGFLSERNLVDFEALEDGNQFRKFWEDGNELAKLLSAEEMHILLLATKLKYTAGRYLRAGMVHILPEILRKYSNSIDQQPGVESCLALLRTAEAGAPLRA